MLEKYGYANHPAKVRRLKSLMPPEDRHFIASFRDQFGVQPPDLLLYRPAERRCWFAEVKGPGDSVSDGQRASWPAITARFGTTVEVVNVVLSADAG